MTQACFRDAFRKQNARAQSPAAQINAQNCTLITKGILKSIKEVQYFCDKRFSFEVSPSVYKK